MSLQRGRINTFRRAVCSHIAGLLPDLRSCEIQFGRFDIDALDRFSVRAPAVRVAVLSGDSQQEAADRKSAELKCAAFAITEGRDHEEAAWDIAEAIFTDLSPARMFGLLQLSGPSKVRITPIVTGNLKNRAVSIIAVEWTQEMRHLGEGIFTDEGHVVTELYINGEEQEPADG